MHTQKNRLPCLNRSGYISAAAHKTGAGILNPIQSKAHNRASGFFVRTVLPRLFRVRIMAGRTGPTSVGPDSLLSGVENPVRLATPRFSTLDGELFLSPSKEATSEFSAMGDVTALSTEDITEGPLAGRTALYAEIEPTERMKQLVADGKKIYSSIELHPQFSVNGRAYLVGLAMTDTPASLGTERLKFTAQQRQAVMTFNSIQGEAPLISEAIESEIIEMAEQRQEEGTQWFNRVMGIIGRGRKADDASFSRIQEAVEGVATSQADIIDRFNVLEARHKQDRQKITSLTTELTALKEKLRTQDGDPQNRFTATGAASDQLADF